VELKDSMEAREPMTDGKLGRCEVRQGDGVGLKVSAYIREQHGIVYLVVRLGAVSDSDENVLATARPAKLEGHCMEL
jgi:hypothetical protein